MKKPELLAPSGNMKTLKAAVQAGADAVYLGAGKFSARAFAGNFDDSELVMGIKYAGSANVKVYLAVNTLMTDRELKEVMSLVDLAFDAGVSAFIVQDLGLARLIRQKHPTAILHASTQMTAKTLRDVDTLGSLGFKRVVMARELSRGQLREIAKNTDVELEVFVHGALCSSYSGQCLISSFFGGRSANRGKCAGPCRLTYIAILPENRPKASRIFGASQGSAADAGQEGPLGSTGKIAGRPKGGFAKQSAEGTDAGLRQKDRCIGPVFRGNGYKSGGKNGVLLSLKDLCLVDYIGELTDMGITSLKIEGRMKGEDYVRGVVGAYRMVLDGGKLTAKDKKAMLGVFDRGGYTDGYFTNNKENMYMETLKNPYGKGAK